MPSRRFHEWSADTYGSSREVNYFIDWPVKFLGKRHRIFFHTPFEAIVIGYLIDGARGAQEGYRHQFFDKAASADPMVKIMFEFIARMKPQSRGIRLSNERPVFPAQYEVVPVYEGVTVYQGVVDEKKAAIKRNVKVITAVLQIIAVLLMD